ncbi:NAD-binding protein [Halorussus gelatinilyticus]|uniref:NAD-binding protein n=1 Tax=Halorussus gelatinilyticus TaxID=2937524 RepID=A0A8U0IKM5_9EURY|nr:NAD-binding protein [Halorussus gelatinilyticus]UPW01181.1 NAD-binding protein [Halorussus gelatinilyticus]
MEVSWRDRVGVRVVVALTFAVAVLSIATGVSSIGFTAASARNLFGGGIPEWAQETAGFTGTLTGFLMLASAFGMRRGLRAAWYSTVLLLPLTAVQGLVQSSPYSLPLVVASLASLAAVLRTRRRFERDADLTASQLASLAALVGVQVYGTVGTYALADHFPEVETPLDAFYYTLVTSSTVGYGDLTPATQTGRLFSLTVVVLGTASFAVALASLLGPAIEARLASALGRMTEAQLELLEDHVVVLGYGDLTEPILNELDGQSDFVVVTPDPQRATELGDRGFKVLKADPSDEEPLRRVGIDEARAVVAATNNDAEDALAVLTARQLNPDVRIVAAATDRENVDKLRRAGADSVISPATIGGHLLVRSALGSDGMENVADRLAGESPKR